MAQINIIKADSRISAYSSAKMVCHSTATPEKTGSERGRLSWLDFAKFVAMAAVLVDHSYNMLYDTGLLQRMSFFSVSLFILAAGYGVQLSYEKKGISYKKQFSTLVHLFLCYCLANIVGLFFYEGSFEAASFFDYLIHFNLQGPYYYFAFFFQLIMIAPLLVKLCDKCSRQKAHWLLHMIVIVCMALCSGWLTHRTNILDIYGGGGCFSEAPMSLFTI